ncbi:5721_t:CDS:2, partial [Scutellospora calospora]
MAIRENNLLLKQAARRAFSPLDPFIRDIVEKNCIISRSGLINQHQKLDAILEEINKILKTLIPPTPQLRHWKVAARNYESVQKKYSRLKSKRRDELLTILEE